MKSLVYVFLFVALLSVLVSCGKKDDSPAPSKEATLSANKWGVESGSFLRLSTSNPDLNTLLKNFRLDYFDLADVENCEKDDYMLFKADKTIYIEDGGVKCNDTDDYGNIGTWSMSPDKTKFTMNIKADSSGLGGEVDEVLRKVYQDMNILKLDANQFQLENSVTTSNDIIFDLESPIPAKLTVSIRINFAKR